MEEPRRPRERELVLAPNEYAYVLDTTKGHINCYVGPNKTSLAQTDELVIFDEREKRFSAVDMQSAVMLFATAPANWYVVLKNPAKDGAFPKVGSSNAMVDLEVGKKVTLPGPVSVPLWPGQMVRVIEGHRLKANQYLVIRVYDAERAQARWREALGLPEEAPAEGAPRFVAGERRVIRGTDVSFYMPPTGVEVVRDEDGSLVRDAVALARLEYCVLVGDDGRRSYVRGEAVVFPEPNQRFLEKDGSRKLRAIELSDTSGIYVKVIAPYVDEDGQEHHEGEELFLTGSQRIYFPREEHAVIRYGDHELHHAIAIPRGEGRYVLDRESGEVALVRGPSMFLPDPRRQVITRRVLSDRECALLYPNNAEALAYNRSLRAKAKAAPAPEAELLAAVDALAAAPAKKARAKASVSDDTEVLFARPDSFVAPRTITLDTKLDGAVAVEVWSGYAVQVVDKSGGRRVVRGPETILLTYDESLEALELSSGKPKTSERRVRTAFLKLAGNKVSDRVRVVTSDLVTVDVGVRYRVSFEGEDPSRWFAVSDYVQLLCDHASSLVKARARRLAIRELRATVTDVVRDAVLGERPSEGGRAGLAFSENGMRVYDVEVLDLEIVDESVGAMLLAAQASAIQREIAVAERETSVTSERRLEELARQLEQEKHESRLLSLQLQALREGQEHELALEREARETAVIEAARQREMRDATLRDEVERQRLTTARAQNEADLARRSDLQALSERALSARVEASVRQAQAFSPHLVEVLRRLGDERLLTSLGENFAELSAIEGRGLLETARKFLDFVPSSFMPTLKNGAPLMAPEVTDEES